MNYRLHFENIINIVCTLASNCILQQDISAFRIATSGQFGQDRFSNMKLHCILACSVVLIFGRTHQATSAHLQSFLSAGMPILDKILNDPCQGNLLQRRSQMDMSRKMQILNDVLLQHGNTAAVSFFYALDFYIDV